MKCYMDPNQTEMTGATVVRFTAEDPCFETDWQAATAASRFLKAASVCCPGEFLGWQLAGTPEGKGSTIAFSSQGACASAEDFKWVFDPCGTVAPADDPRLFSEEFEKVYVLKSRPAREEREGEKSAESDRPGREQYRELLSVIASGQAVLRIFAGGGDEGAATVLLGMPKPMPLRMRAMLSFAFPETETAEFHGSDGDDGSNRLPQACLQAAMRGLIEALTHESAWTETVKSDEGEALEDIFEEPDEPAKNLSGFTPIEELDLSVRTYNCLKRAGCDSVEQLRAMTEADLRQVRNLSGKCIEEIRQRLAEMEAWETSTTPAAKSGFQLLEELIGLGNVKEQVRKIAAYARMKRDMEERDVNMEPIVLNMAFVGNPGTAKTTVARIMASILHEVGLLSDGALLEVGRADLIARYEGQTADKVKEVFRRAKGRLLFIDEAYSLLENNEGEFGDEAISTIVQEMENNRKDTVVVFAGYPDKMEAFFARNPGLKSRVPFHIAFSDYSLDEMTGIVRLEAGKRGFALSQSAQEKMPDILERGRRQQDSGNGRLCRNLVENGILNYAARVYGDDSGAGGDFILQEQDLILPDQPCKPAASRIGF